MHDSTARPTSHVFRLVFLWLGISILTVFAGSPFAAGSELRKTPIVKAVQNARGVGGEHPRRKDRCRRRQPGCRRSEAGRRVNGMGTGVVIDPRGYIITNHHVVDGVHEIQVTLADGRPATSPS